MNHSIFVGLDVHKATISVAMAQGVRGEEVRNLGIILIAPTNQQAGKEPRSSCASSITPCRRPAKPG
ncbi:hypothetical protein XH83_39035 (plasmid) [Bradyrhizobium sp. CCBAU 53351]|uniref:IS110 family transposase n=2 Tax=Bradyrhizobium TaxID=374 RepID=A0AAE5X8R1_9BRAD|nr:hypothetical protein X265_36945 [Bradyrhizobium guangdongense]QAU50761.1 hypothetical protein XH91_36155 [Bradyrhizobium guangzhouense]QOZ49647.1 hypothetical protein XH89_40105 [Bradyrhizobium sp. CCBAU 53340]QOZ56765.1 hypothetical protein XH90_35895 [Bradyrhizobium sp. CCBAU 53338]QOZ81407.1 hypothetical protein XH83_39035 [Bradyrhizobium sp. CCBAU 53351]